MAGRTVGLMGNPEARIAAFLILHPEESYVGAEILEALGYHRAGSSYRHLTSLLKKGLIEERGKVPTQTGKRMSYGAKKGLTQRDFLREFVFGQREDCEETDD